MIAANNSFPADVIDPDAPAEWYHAKLPDISNETAKRITKARSWPMFSAIILGFRQQQRKGRNAEVRAAAEGYQISTGIRNIARSIGLDAKAGRTQCRRLADLGVIAMTQDDRPLKTLDAGEVAELIRSESTGKILVNRAGRAKPVTITLTLKNCHMRPQSKAKKSAKLVGSTDSTKSRIGGVQTPPTFSDRGRVDPTSKESLIELNREGPIALADGIGRPMAAGQAAAQQEALAETPASVAALASIIAGRLDVFSPMAEANSFFEEKGDPVDSPPVPQGSRPRGPRIAPVTPRPAGRAAGYTKPAGRQNAFSEDPTPRQWSAASEDAFRYTKEKLDRQQAEREGRVYEAGR